MDRRKEQGGVTDEFIEGVNEFMEFARNSEEYLRQEKPKMRCPCKICKSKRYHYGDDVMAHLYEKGFMPNYYYWTSHS